MKLRYLPDAQRELNGAVAYYHERNPVVARHFADSVRNVERQMVNFPLASPAVGRGQHSLRVPYFPYSLVYCPKESEILVVAVAHHSRRPGYWKKRLQDIH